MTRTKVDAFDGGEEPEELEDWLAAGFAASDAEPWRRWRFTIARANAWIAVGVTSGVQAAQWSTAGVGPDGVGRWRDAGIDAPEAVRWHEFGITLQEAGPAKKAGQTPESHYAQRAQQARAATQFGGPGVALGHFGGPMPGQGAPRQAMQFVQRFGEAGIDGRLVHSYVTHGWLDDDAVEWARWGIAADEAYLWFDLGLRPHEAGRLILQGQTPGEVVREWWKAAIPFEEVADWIGAGLSVAEAVAQRSRGITSEHAAALRALRDEEGGEPQATRHGRLPHARRGAPRLEQAGPPPDDEESARAAVARAFSNMGDVDETRGDVPSVEGSEGLAACREQAKELARLRFGEVPDVETVFTVDAVRFINDHEAAVTYTVRITGSLNITLGDRPGRAILVDGEWKVTRETFCEWMQVGGVECPPRPGA